MPAYPDAPSPRPTLVREQPKDRLFPDRFRRIWGMVEAIAEAPGWSRRELADRFILSERQVQADLTIIRHDMRLPLVRDRGYRFTGEGGAAASGGLTIEDALLLVTLVETGGDRRLLRGRERIDSLVSKLPVVFPPHLQPLVTRMLDAVRSAKTVHNRLFVGLASATLRGGWLRLSYPYGTGPAGCDDPIVKPELILPYCGGWYVIAETDPSDRTRSRMLPLDTVTAVTLAGVPDAQR